CPDRCLVSRRDLQLMLSQLGPHDIGQPLLMTRDNPGGHTLEGLAEKLRMEIQAKSLRIAGDTRAEAQAVCNNNFQIVGLLMQIEALQRDSLLMMSQLGPDNGPTGQPRVGR
ncbi:MAG: hypothetical protein LPH21_03225, partial [Shewanella sp.]|nr:hypothetical protein [Shewanella sp.]